jgi:hypothetical protein
VKLLGRRAEWEAVDGLLTDALAGHSRVIVLREEAGVGKTALLGYLSDRVEGWYVATAAGVESEMELAYSGLHQLCAPMLDRLERLPSRSGTRSRSALDRRCCGRSSRHGVGQPSVPRSWCRLAPAQA